MLRLALSSGGPEAVAVSGPPQQPEELLELIVGMQSRRMDEQRATLPTVSEDCRAVSGGGKGGRRLSVHTLNTGYYFKQWCTKPPCEQAVRTGKEALSRLVGFVHSTTRFL